MPAVAYQYLPILLFIAVGIAFSVIFVGAPVLVSKLTGTSKPDVAKLSEYESGFPAFTDSRQQFDVREAEVGRVGGQLLGESIPVEEAAIGRAPP